MGTWGLGVCRKFHTITIRIQIRSSSFSLLCRGHYRQIPPDGFTGTELHTNRDLSVCYLQMGSEVSVSFEGGFWENLGTCRNMTHGERRLDGSTVCHLFIVTFSYMENRKPFNLKLIIAAYNIFQVMACSYLVLNVSLPTGIQSRGFQSS